MGVKRLIVELFVLTSIMFCIYAVSVSDRPPIVVNQSQTSYVHPQSSLLLRCKADGWPLPNISWYRDSAPLTSFNASLENDSLVIPSVKDGIDSSTAGVQYQCAASNSFGTVLGAMIKVYTLSLGVYQGPAKVTYFLENTATSFYFDDVALYCNISGSNVPLSIVWLDEQNRTVPDPRIINNPYTVLNGGLYLIIRNFNPTLLATKTFHCAVANLSNSPLGTATLYNFTTAGYYSSQPYLYKRLQDVVAYDGDGNITFSIIAACIGDVAVLFTIIYVPLGSQLQAGTVLNSQQRGVGILMGPVSVNDNGTTIGCSVDCGPFGMQQTILYTAALIVLASPSFNSSPNNNLNYIQGQSASFSCVYRVSQELKLTWYKNGAVITNNSHTLISRSLLSIPSMLLSDYGMYQCSVSNGTTNVWRQWAVFVRIPIFRILPSRYISPIVANLGSNFMLIFQLLANVASHEVHIQWYFNGTAIQSSNVFQVSKITQVMNSSEDGTLYNASLLISSIDLSKTQGFYYASFFSIVGIVNTSSIFITPPVSGQILSFIATTQCLSLGITVQMQCAVYGYPVPTVIFLANNALIVTNDHITLINNTLIIQNTHFSDAAIYTCQIPSVEGASLSIDLPLCFTLLASGPQGGTVTAGSSATIHCIISSYSNLPISWYKNGLPFDTIDGGEQATHTLAFASVKPEDSGIYACSVGGVTSNNFTLFVSPIISQGLIIGISVGGFVALSLLVLVLVVVVISAWHICRVKGTDLVPLIQVFVSPLTSSDAHSIEES